MATTASHRSVRRIVRSSALVGLPFLLIACVILWIATYRRVVTVDYRFGSHVAPTAADKNWAYRAQTLSATSLRGRLLVSSSTYISWAPTRQELLGWSEHAGWRTYSANNVVPNSGRPDVFWKGVTDFSLLGLGLEFSQRQGELSRSIGIPYWSLSLAAVGVWMWLWIPHRRRRARIAAGCCIACGYSRDGLKEGDPCPECGAASSSASPA